ncbi:MAG: hypothetical protein ACLRZH_17000 [Ruthenibacterium lactatiformans]
MGATITSTCKNVDRVVEWLDYMYSAEGQMLLNMGIEGTHYTMQDGEPIFTDYILNNPDGLSPKQAVGTFTIAQGTMPSVLCFSETSQRTMLPCWRPRRTASSRSWRNPTNM